MKTTHYVRIGISALAALCLPGIPIGQALEFDLSASRIALLQRRRNRA